MKHQIRLSTAAALILVGIACGSPPPGSTGADTDEATPRSVVARVNGQPIPKSRLDAIIEAERLHQGRDSVTFDAADADLTLHRRREALRLAIRAELVYQAAVEHGLTVAEDDVDRRLQVARSQFPSEAEFLQHLDSAGTTEDALRAEARRRLLMQAYANTVTDSIEIDETAVEALVQDEPSHLQIGEQVRVAHILVRLRPGDSAERRRVAREKIEQAHARVLAGEDFAELARHYSESPLAERGGDMGYLPRGRMLPEFEDVAFAIPVGQVSEVFETPHGLNVVKVLDRKRSDPVSLEEMRTGLLLVLAREQSSHALREHVDQLEQRSEIEILDPELR
jgi:peptidyl-prolyl cis-trans isomerase C